MNSVLMINVQANGITMNVVQAKMVPANVYCEYLAGEYFTGEWQSQNEQKILNSYLSFV